MIFICKRNSVQSVSCSACLYWPVLPTICWPEDDTITAYCGSIVNVGKADIKKIVASPAYLARPALSCICSFEDYSISTRHNCCIWINIRNRIKSSTYPTYSVYPAIAAVCGCNNCTVITHGNSKICICKINSVKPVSCNKTWLAYPGCSAVCSPKRSSDSSDSGTTIQIAEWNPR